VGVYFFDASAAVKRYAEETGTDWIRALTSPLQGHFLYIARVSEVEVTSALARKRHQGAIDTTRAGAALAQFRKDLAHDYRVVEWKWARKSGSPALLMITALLRLETTR
jgi:uncharacterized protein